MEDKELMDRSLPTKSQVETERRRYRWQKAYFKALRGTISVLTYVAAVAALIATLVLPVLQIEGISMDPTLTSGDIVLLKKSTRMDRGDICGFAWSNKLLVKRVIGIPGDWIEIDLDGTVYCNGEKLDEPYLTPSRNDNGFSMAPFTLGEEEYFVMGDNRDNSHDSRNYYSYSKPAAITRDMIVGKVRWVVFPFGNIRGLE